MLNFYQTQLEDLNLSSYPDEVQEQFYDFINNVPYIRNLISENRPYAKDLPRDDEGKIIIDLTNPPVLSDMDYFRPSALHYQKHGCYTFLRPNPNPNSEYGKWLRQEVYRSWYGYIREEDGLWIPGDYYFFLNYCPIQLIKHINGKANRVIDFPNIIDGQLFRSWYLYLSRNHGHHSGELAKRGAGKSFYNAATLAKRFLLGESKDVRQKVQCVVTANERKYIQGANQILDMFQYYIDFLANHTQFPRRRITNSLQNLQWTSGYVDVDTGTRKGSQNSVIGITSKDDSEKLRGSRGVLYLLEEAGCHLKGTEVLMADGTIQTVENIKLGDKVMGDDGTERTVLKCYSGLDMMYKVTLSNGDYQIVNSKHPIYFKKYDWSSKKYTDFLLTAPEVMQIKNLNKGYYIIKSDKVQYPYQEVPIHPYWLGLWLGDGDKSGMEISNEDPEVLEWLHEYCCINSFTYKSYYLQQSKKCYNFCIRSTNSVWKEFRKLDLRNNKHIPDIYKFNSREVLLQILAGAIDTDGTLNRKKQYYEITQVEQNKRIIDDLAFICRLLGFRISITTRIAGRSSLGCGHLNYRLRISGDIDQIPVKIERKKIVKRHTERNRRNWLEYTFKVEPWGFGEYYGFTLDKNQLFLTSDFTVTHNTFSHLLELFNTIRPSVEDGDSVFGQIVFYGTSGSDESDFSSMQELAYNPEGYNVEKIPNVYDKEGQGRPYFIYFFPGYLGRDGNYDANGNSNVTKSLLSILADRYKVKYNSTDINSITRRIAEIPITPQEAILRTRGNIFPVTQLTERLNQLDSNPNVYDDVFVGTLVFNSQNRVEFKPTSDLPIRDFPLKDNKVAGALEIFKMPEKDREGNVFNNRYIASVDPIDDDESFTMSLYSMFVLDLFTDTIVAEYTGRLPFADDNFELSRKLALFYNAKILYENNKKGLYAYFQRLNCLHLLADTPDYLKDKDLVKYTGIGNKSKGVAATLPINNYGNSLIRDWLLKPYEYIEMIDGEEVKQSIPNLYRLRNRALIKEAILFNPDINVDRLRSLSMLMIYREEKMIQFQGDLTRDRSYVPQSYEGNDPFFSRNFKPSKAVNLYNKNRFTY